MKAKIALVAMLLFSSFSPAFAHPDQYIIYDTTNNVVLAEHNADMQNYPASLTKMMTLYLLFSDIEAGRVKLDTEFTVSRHASEQEPSKIYLKPGDKITVLNLILSIVTHSANDSAVVIAENLAGSEGAFAMRMNYEAKKLGMTNTFYRNASGLPNPGQHTTPRDMVKLALALQQDFPKEYHYFATTEFHYKGATYATHDHLMQHFKGMDGIKTGFIDAAGFNLVSSAVRDGRRLIGVVMGGPSATIRDKEMSQLMNAAFDGYDLQLYANTRYSLLHHFSLIGTANAAEPHRIAQHIKILHHRRHIVHHKVEIK